MRKNLTIHFFVQFVHKQGTYFRFHNIAVGLSNLGHTVRVYGAVYQRNEKSFIEIRDGVEYNIISCYSPLQRIFGQFSHPIAGIKRSLKRYPKCDVAHLFQPHISAYLPWFFNRSNAKRNFYDWDDLWTDGLVRFDKFFYNRWLYIQVKYIEKKAPVECDAVTVCSSFLLRKAKALGADNATLIYNGYWSYIPNEKLVSRKKINMLADNFYLGFMGRTIDDIAWCFELLSRLRNKYPFVRLALCGMPEEALGNIHDSLKGEIDYLGLLDPEVTKDFATAIDVGLLPLYDNAFNQSRFPIKFAEYLAAGVPVLCTNVGECGQIAQKFPFVKTVDANIESWLNGGVQLVDKIIEHDWPTVNRNEISKELNWDNISGKLEEVYMNN